MLRGNQGNERLRRDHLEFIRLRSAAVELPWLFCHSRLDFFSVNGEFLGRCDTDLDRATL
jgi:hypothetical protein